MTFQIGQRALGLVDADAVGFGELEALGIGIVLAVFLVDGLELKGVEETKQDEED